MADQHRYVTRVSFSFPSSTVVNITEGRVVGISNLLPVDRRTNIAGPRLERYDPIKIPLDRRQDFKHNVVSNPRPGVRCPPLL